MLQNPNFTVEVFRMPVNAIFEAMSGFTSTSLTMAKDSSQLTYSMQWWPSLHEWTGGSGFIVLSFFLLNTNHENKSLYQAETRNWIYHDKLSYTLKAMLVIYLILSSLSAGIFYLLGMPFWEAINHGLTAISTGGFAVTKDSFADYSLTIKKQL
jgi:trk system potassium uptake protein TrkH